MQISEKKQFLKEAQMAVRYGISIRALQFWMRAGVITAYFKVKSVVRFDAEACDAELLRRR